MIQFKGVHKWFGKLHVLDNIHLDVEAGEVVVICGPSGSGKSTLIRCITALRNFKRASFMWIAGPCMTIPPILPNCAAG
jgi:polar amino acid transport system ATP-binding protein